MKHKQALPCSAAAERNAPAILAVLQSFIRPGHSVLEIASGTGQHVVHFATHLSEVCWQPSDIDAAACATAAQRVAIAALPNVREPLVIDVTKTWPRLQVDAVVVANMLHISPPETLPGLCRGAREVCADQGWLHIYGPFKVNGKHNAPSNAAFDASLRARNPLWGLRDLAAVLNAAAQHGWRLHEQRVMPANNFSLVFQAEGPTPTNQ